MTELILTTYVWVPEITRGYVRDLRVRWALEAAGVPYRIESVRFVIATPSITRTNLLAKCRG